MRNEIKNTIQEFEAKAEKIKANKGLSQYGRTQALEKLEQEKAEALKAFIPALRKRAIEESLAAAKYERIASAAGELMGYDWDYNRLNYEAAAAKSAAKRHHGEADKLAREWEQVKASGDRYKVKAWIDNVPGELIEPDAMMSYSHSEYVSLLDDMTASETLLHGEEQREYLAEAETHARELAGIGQLAAVIDNELFTGRNTGTRPVVQRRVMEGIQFTDEGVKTDFELPADDPNRIFSEPKTDDEKLEELYQQLETARAENMAITNELAAKMGVELDEV